MCPVPCERVWPAVPTDSQTKHRQEVFRVQKIRRFVSKKPPMRRIGADWAVGRREAPLERLRATMSERIRLKQAYVYSMGHGTQAATRPSLREAWA